MSNSAPWPALSRRRSPCPRLPPSLRPLPLPFRSLKRSPNNGPPRAKRRAERRGKTRHLKDRMNIRLQRDSPANPQREQSAARASARLPILRPRGRRRLQPNSLNRQRSAAMSHTSGKDSLAGLGQQGSSAGSSPANCGAIQTLER